MQFLFLSLFTLAGAFGALSDGKVHLSLAKMHLKVQVDDGFHVNQEAPVKVMTEKGGATIRPAALGTHNIDFDLGGILDDKFKVSFYVCDDKNTSCELQKNTYEIKNNELVPAVMTEPSAIRAVPPQIEYNAHHFVKDNLATALNQAKKDKKLLFVDFSAPWCPACVRLETEVFNERSFKKLTKNLITATLNTDLDSNREEFKKYNVKVLPTLIIMNAEGSELYRMIDYKPISVFNHELALALKNSHQTTEELTALASNKDKKAIETLATRAFLESNYKVALKWYELLGVDSLPYAISRTSVAETEYEKDKKNEAEYAALLKKDIALYPAAYEALDWRLSLSEIDKTNSQDLLRENISILMGLLKNKGARKKMFSNASTGTISFPHLEIYSYLVKSYEKLGDSELLKKSLAHFQAEIRKVKTTTKRPGEAMMIIQYQREAKMPEEEKTLLSLVNAYPNSHTYHMKLGGFYFRNKKFNEALPQFLASTGLEKPVTLFNLSYLAKTQKELGLVDEMKKTIELADSLPEARSERSKESLKEMHDLLIQK
ncbi:MAG: thioredoxin family protein [Bacteriovorax sp.]